MQNALTEGRQTDSNGRQAGRQTDTQTDGWTDRQTDRQTVGGMHNQHQVTQTATQGSRSSFTAAGDQTEQTANQRATSRQDTGELHNSMLLDSTSVHLRAPATGDCNTCLLQLLLELHDPLILAPELLLSLRQLASQVIALVLQDGLLCLQNLPG